VPEVEHYPTVGSVGGFDDAPRRVQVWDAPAQGDEFQLANEPSVGRPVTHVGEVLGELVHRNGAYRGDRDGGERLDLEGLPDSEEVVDVEREEGQRVP